MALQSHKIKGFEGIDLGGKMRFFQNKPRRYKFWFINIHFYRMPVALGIDGLFGRKRRKSERWHLSWEEWRLRIKKVCPFQYWLRNDFLGGISGFFRYRLPKYTTYPYNSLKKRLKGADNIIKIKDTSIYADESVMILHSMFYLLCRYVEKQPQDTICMDDTPEMQEWWNKVQKYYKYWKEDRIKLETERENSYPDWDKLDPDATYEVAYGKLNELEKKIKDLDTEALQFIVETRENFWI